MNNFLTLHLEVDMATRDLHSYKILPDSEMLNVFETLNTLSSIKDGFQ